MIKLIKIAVLMILVVLAYMYLKEKGYIGQPEPECKQDTDCWPERFEPSTKEVYQCILNKCYHLNLTK